MDVFLTFSFVWHRFPGSGEGNTLTGQTGVAQALKKKRFHVVYFKTCSVKHFKSYTVKYFKSCKTYKN